MHGSKRTFTILILAALLFSACQPVLPTTPVIPTETPKASTPTPQAEPTPDPVAVLAQSWLGMPVKDEITSEALADNLIGDPAKRQFFVLLPPSYDESDKRYPVVYVLHWFTSSPYGLQTIIQPYKQMLQNGEAKEIILVFPDGSNKFGGSNYRSSPTIGDYETYIAKELVDYVDANYRTIPHKDSRGITGGMMGGDGTIHLALTHPDIFGVAVPAGTTYDFSIDPAAESAVTGFRREPQDLTELSLLGYDTRVYISIAAAAAPNPDAPPFYLDMPFALVDGKAQVVPEVWQKIVAVDSLHDVEEYLAQPDRLTGILLVQGTEDTDVPVEMGQSFSRLLADKGIKHEYVEVDGGDPWIGEVPALQFFSDHLSFQEQ